MKARLCRGNYWNEDNWSIVPGNPRMEAGMTVLKPLRRFKQNCSSNKRPL
jgi:hypothetical protein